MTATQGSEEKIGNSFVLVKLPGNKFVRYTGSEDPIPLGEVVTTSSTIEEMTKEQLGELYGTLIGSNPKNFKDKKIAIESVSYQIGKLQATESLVLPPAAVAAQKSAKKDKATGVAKEKATSFELLAPENLAEAMAKLPPQARAVISAMTDVVTEKGRSTFTGAELEERLKRADSPLTTRQEPMRIVSYYREKLTGAGLVKVS